MDVLYRLHFATAWRLRQLLRPLVADRGDSPVPSAIIIAGLAIIAIGVLAWLVTYVEGFMDDAPTDLPDGPEGG
ncbi:MAG: hypothetical protein GEV12_14975 [Micromonosporaceae bacterium]|nr:hypothetical protein [Micromonosporaceae bacterium]